MSVGIVGLRAGTRTTENAGVSEQQPGPWPTLDDDTLARFEAMWERTRRVAETARAARDRADSGARIDSLAAELEQAVSELDGLRTAMRTRAAIEQAKGVIMGFNGCSENVAFATLVRLSQASQRKLHEVAALLVSQVADGEDGRRAVIDLTRARVPPNE
jgi:hypothetical protein